MSFFIARNETEIDRLSSVDSLMKANADYYRPRFEAIKELRDMDDGTLHRGQGFRRVASLVNVPLWHVKTLVDPGFMKDKRKFYAWLKKNPQYKTYDNRGGSRPSVTFTQGEQIVHGG